MKVQVIENARGKATGVFIPIDNWKQLKKQYKDLERIEYTEPDKDHILKEMKEAVTELALIRKGKLKARPAKELLDEL